MTNTQTSTPQIAKPKAVSLYPYQIGWLLKQATQAKVKSEANPSKVIQKLIDRAMEKEMKGSK